LGRFKKNRLLARFLQESLDIKSQCGVGGESEILDAGAEDVDKGSHTWISSCGQKKLRLIGNIVAWMVTADTKPQNYPAMHTGHEAIKRLLKCHLLNCRFQLINPHDLEVPGGQTFAIWPLEPPCSLEDEPAL
jgi:hypothetical protein